MANPFAIHSVGSSLITALRNAYHDYQVPAGDPAKPSCDFRLLSSGEMATADTANLTTTLSLFLYRITMNEHLRNSGYVDDSMLDGSVPLAVDLHYLLIVWASSAEAEHFILGWAMRQLHLRPVLDISALSPEGGWTRGDIVRVIPAELSTEDLMRIWDSLEAHYRLSVSYIARVVRIDADTVPDSRPVVATRFSARDMESVP